MDTHWLSQHQWRSTEGNKWYESKFCSVLKKRVWWAVRWRSDTKWCGKTELPYVVRHEWSHQKDQLFGCRQEMFGLRYNNWTAWFHWRQGSRVSGGLAVYSDRASKISVARFVNRREKLSLLPYSRRMRGACERLLSDPEFADQMRYQKHKYYLNEVEPSVLVYRCLETAMSL